MAWKVVERRIGKAGSLKQRSGRQREWDNKYGEGCWEVGYLVDGAFISQEEALETIYYRSYVQHFEQHPADLEELIRVAKVLRNPHAQATTGVDLQVPAITDYLKYFGDRPLEIRPGARLYFNYLNLVVNAHPDLVAEENGRLLLIKLNCCKDDFAGGVTSTLLHVLYESARLKGLAIDSNSVECLQTSSGSRITGPKTGFPSTSALNSACKELLEIWPAA